MKITLANPAPPLAGPDHGWSLGSEERFRFAKLRSSCSRSWLFYTENTTVGETGARVRVRGLEGADARSGDPAIDPDDAARWPRLTCHTPELLQR